MLHAQEDPIIVSGVGWMVTTDVVQGLKKQRDALRDELYSLEMLQCEIPADTYEERHHDLQERLDVAEFHLEQAEHTIAEERTFLSEEDREQANARALARRQKQKERSEARSLERRQKQAEKAAERKQRAEPRRQIASQVRIIHTACRHARKLIQMVQLKEGPESCELNKAVASLELAVQFKTRLTLEYARDCYQELESLDISELRVGARRIARVNINAAKFILECAWARVPTLVSELSGNSLA